MRESVEYIYGIPKFSKKASLDNTKEMLRRLGNPQDNFKIIHVAGTNGKGSVCAYLNGILKKKGCHRGLFTSPHLVTMNERIAIDDAMVSDEIFDEGYRTLRQISEEMMKDGYAHPSFFEFIFGMAMYIFNCFHVEYVVLETGLGGRLDATNAVDHPILTIITSISLDHTDILGDTYAEIAYEKAGIIKKNIPVVYIDKRPDVTEVIQNKAKEMNSMAIAVSPKDISDIALKDKYIDFLVNNEYYCNIRFSIRTEAIYQTENGMLAAVAAKVIHLAEEEAIVQGLKQTTWSGRMQEVLPDFMVDGAHNDDGILRFLESVRSDGYDGRRILLFSAVRDKHYDGMIKELCSSGLFNSYNAVQLADSRGLDIDTIGRTFQKYTHIDLHKFSNIMEALEDTFRFKKTGMRIYAVGSLYLIGEILEFLSQKGDID